MQGWLRFYILAIPLTPVLFLGIAPSLEQGALDFPGVFEEPVLPFAALEGDVRWQSNNGQIQVDVDRLRFSNADAQGEVEGSWRTSGFGSSTNMAPPAFM